MRSGRYEAENGWNIETTFLSSGLSGSCNLNFFSANGESDNIRFWVHIEDTAFSNIDFFNEVNAPIQVSKSTAFKLGFYGF